jgi:hypothetical protein
MGDFKEHLVCIQLCFKLGKYALKTFEMLEVASGEQAQGKTKVFTGFPCSKVV